MPQPIDQYSVVRFQAPGTTVVSSDPVVLHSLFKQVGLAGTMTFFDINAAASTAAGNVILSLGTAFSNEAGAGYPRLFDYQFKKGLVVETLGTLDVILAYS